MKHIQESVADEMQHFEKKFRQSMKSNVMLLDKITGYLVRRKGKRIRPLFVFLSAAICGGITEATYRGASLIELLHTATLVHDDIVDNANKRRGFFSINMLWKNKIAVLVGDFLLSRGLILSVENGDYNLLKITTAAVKEMSEGELLQIEKTKRLNVSEEDYYKIIQQKTASLIIACCKVGATSANASPMIVEKIGEFGKNVGIAFQIKDDLFDYGEHDIGKPVGIDIKEKKMTLPLIHTLQNSSPSNRRKIKRWVRKSDKNKKYVTEVISVVKKSGGIDYANKTMNHYRDLALQTLSSFPASKYKDALYNLVEYTILRTK